MGATISLVRTSNPDGVIAAAGSMQQAVADVQRQIHFQQRHLSVLGQSWGGDASRAAMSRGEQVVQAQSMFRQRLHTMQTALASGGQQLSAIRTQILSTALQALTAGGVVSNDGTVRPTGTGQLMTPAVAKAYSTVLQGLLKAGLVIARQNPSVDVAGHVKVAAPDVKVQQAPDGAVRIQYDAKNAFAPPGSDLSGHVVRGDVVVTPGAGGQPATVDGIVGDYPSLEVYQNMPDGSTHTLAQDAADSGNPLGPLTELPFSHEIANGSAAFEPFESYAPQLPGGPRYPGDTVPYVPGQVDINAPTDLKPTDKVPDVVVVR